MSSEVAWSEVSQEEFDQIPGKPAPKPNQWDELLTAVDQGKAMRIPVENGNKLKGFRIGIGRRAKTRQIPIETRATADALYIRRGVDRDAATSLAPAIVEEVAPEQAEPTGVAARASRSRGRPRTRNASG